MAVVKISDIQLRRGTAERWTSKNPILDEGEPGFESDTGLFKLGDGVTAWTDLDYFRPHTSVIPGDDSSAMNALIAHIEAQEPHPVYDDGPSLLLLYENAKV